MGTVYQRATTIVKNYFQNALSDAVNYHSETAQQNLLNFGVLVSTDYRLHVLFSPEQARKFWVDEIRSKDDITDFVLCLKNRLFVELDDAETKALITSIVSAFRMDPPQKELSLIDDTLYQRSPDRDFLIDLLHNNPWIVPLYLLSMMSMRELLEEDT